MDKGSGPYFYLPKLQSAEEAKLWAEVFQYAEERLGLSKGTIKCTVLIEHLLASFQVSFSLVVPVSFFSGDDQMWVYPDERDHLRAEGLHCWIELWTMGLHLLLHQDIPESQKIPAPGSIPDWCVLLLRP